MAKYQILITGVGSENILAGLGDDLNCAKIEQNKVGFDAKPELNINITGIDIIEPNLNSKDFMNEQASPHFGVSNKKQNTK